MMQLVRLVTSTETSNQTNNKTLRCLAIGRCADEHKSNAEQRSTNQMLFVSSLLVLPSLPVHLYSVGENGEALVDGVKPFVWCSWCNWGS